MSSDVAVVTGAAKGIGRACAIHLARRGLDVALLGRGASELDALATELREQHPNIQVVALSCDVASSAAVELAAARVLDALGVPSVVVNNAGVVHRALVDETTEEAWDHVLDVNLKGPFLVTRSFLPAMRRRGRGRFVQLSSISGTLGTPSLSAYCASKWGLVGFTKSLAEELRGTGLQALTILPGSVDTAMLVGSGFPPQMTPDKVAEVVTYAALDAPPAMNGASIDVFGP